ncbi:LuxR C-terminal-related transcriptional regulator [Novispirillum itersonii]|uniref:LuxR C-terminal-related transcriptional regulator n=1 Tax=Novispirillum itersonii TaxID=189 RepID=UPI000377B241|nr:response regulator transcription factor [Novispirillum itersonii]
MTGEEPKALAAVLLTRLADNHAGQGDAVQSSGPLAFLAGDDRGRPTVVVADHHRLVRQGLVSVLAGQGGCAVVAEADDWTALAAALSARPAVVIVASRLPGLEGAPGIARIRAANPDGRVLLLGNDPAPAALIRQDGWGADGQVLENEDAAVLIAALYAVLAGQRHQSPEVLRLCATEGLLPEQTPTARERQVLELIAAGLSNKAIAREMGISVKTVEKHRDSVMRKLNAHNAASLLLRARDSGLL